MEEPYVKIKKLQIQEEKTPLLKLKEKTYDDYDDTELNLFYFSKDIEYTEEYYNENKTTELFQNILLNYIEKREDIPEYLLREISLNRIIIKRTTLQKIMKDENKEYILKITECLFRSSRFDDLKVLCEVCLSGLYDSLFIELYKIIENHLFGIHCLKFLILLEIDITEKEYLLERYSNIENHLRLRHVELQTWWKTQSISFVICNSKKYEKTLFYLSYKKK